MPLWRILRCTPHEPIRLNALPWLGHACEGWDFAAVEQYLVTPDMWSFRRVASDSIWPNPLEPTILLRVVGVEHCPLFGLELEVIHRQLGLAEPPMDIPVIDNRVDLALRHVRVLVWTQVSTRPFVTICVPDGSERGTPTGAPHQLQ